MCIIAIHWNDNSYNFRCNHSTPFRYNGEYLYLALSRDDLQVSSVVINEDVSPEKEITEQLLKLEDTGMRQENQMAFMFACCRRGNTFHRKVNFESVLFHKTYPGVPIFGLFGNGELGTEFLPQLGLSNCFEDTPSFTDGTNILHVYSTVFVLM